MAPLGGGDRRLGLEQLLVRGGAVVGIQRERRQSPPALDALRQAGLAARVGIQQRVARVQALEERAVGPGLPARVGAVDHVHDEFQQLAVADVHGLADHVRVGVLRDGGVHQAGVILGVEVLLDGTPRPADGHGVVGHVIELDEPLLDHQRGLAAELHVVVRAGSRAGRVQDRVAAPQRHVVERAGTAEVALAVADGHAAVEAVDHLAVPGAAPEVAGTLVERGQHGDAVDEAVDRPAFLANDEVHGLAVGRGRLCHVVRARHARRVVLPRARLAPVAERHQRRRGAVAAVADQVAGRVERLRAGRGIVGDRLAQPLAHRRADEGILVGAGKYRTRDRVIGEREAHGRRPALALAVRFHDDGVVAQDQAVDDAGQRARAGHHLEVAALIHAVDPDLGLVQRHGAWHLDVQPRVATGHLVRRRRDDLHSELVAGGVGLHRIDLGENGLCGRQQSDENHELLHVLPLFTLRLVLALREGASEFPYARRHPLYIRNRCSPDHGSVGHLS